MRNIYIKTVTCIIVLSVLAVALASCIRTNMGGSALNIDSEPNNKEQYSETPSPTVYIDYLPKTESALDVSLLLETVENAANGILPSDLSEYTYIFNRHLLSRYASDDMMKRIILELYVSMLTSQVEYTFPSDAQITTTELADLLSVIKSDTPEFLHINDEYTRYTDPDTGLVRKLQFTFSDDPERYYEKLCETLGILEKWKSDTEEEGAYGRELYVYDRIMQNCEYSLSGKDVASAYGALVRGSALCEGYSDAFTLSMFYMGIECMQVYGMAVNSSGDEQSHAWNYVKPGDDWYEVDITWDDIDSVIPTPLYAYFNITHDEMSVNHTTDDIFSKMTLPECNAEELNYHRMNDCFIEADADVEDAFFDILNREVPEDAEDERDMTVKFESEEDYDEFRDRMDDLLNEWNNGRSYTYISLYKYVFDEKLFVVSFLFELSDV
ncbi:MAG: hypothetical protein IJO93_03140 [Clostridia bacterium]|nr:hypothetical protein [Clostridia bacterium]